MVKRQLRAAKHWAVTKLTILRRADKAAGHNEGSVRILLMEGKLVTRTLQLNDVEQTDVVD